MKIKAFASKIHLWLGLICGPVVVISMLAAALFVWDEELTDWYYADAIFVAPKEKTLPLTDLLAIAKKTASAKEILDIEVFRDPSRAYIFSTYANCDSCKGWTYWSESLYWDRIYINPYTGQVTGQVDMLYNWIDLTRRLHQNLLLRYAYGHYIVGFATLFIFAMILTGIILWFPKNKAALKQRFTIKWTARWRRVNYDIHNVGGFYTWLIVFILAVTGLVWTFEWWTDGIYRLLGDDPKKMYASHAPPTSTSTTHPHALERSFRDVQQRRPSWTRIVALIPPADTTTVGKEYSYYVMFREGSGWDEADDYHYNLQTGAFHFGYRFEEKALGEKWRNSNYAIHVGSIYGLPTKILASFSALFLASLPVTGLLIYIGRKKKKEKSAVPKPRQVPHTPKPLKKTIIQ